MCACRLPPGVCRADWGGWPASAELLTSPSWNCTAGNSSSSSAELGLREIVAALDGAVR